MKFQHLKPARKTKKQRKLSKGGNDMVSRSIACKNKIGDYLGQVPVYYNRAKPTELPHFVKVQAGIPFVRAELHAL